MKAEKAKDIISTYSSDITRLNPLCDLHTHTVFSDGKDSVEDMVQAAFTKGLKVFGISDHSYTFFDESYCMPKERIESYRYTIDAARASVPSSCSLFLGIEQDYYSAEPTDAYDYVIGSVHYIRIPSSAGKSDIIPEGCFLCEGFIYIPVDETPEILKSAARLYFDGDMMNLVKLYFETVSDIKDKTDADIIGHFDLISKFNEDQSLFSFDDPVYISAWKQAADRLLQTNAVFEINTGAVYKRYRTMPYPSAQMIYYISQKGGRFILSSDAHEVDQIAWGFTFR